MKEEVNFFEGIFPQDSECEYGQVDMHEKWGEGFRIVRCCHPKSNFGLCANNHHMNRCPVDKKTR